MGLRDILRSFRRIPPSVRFDDEIIVRTRTNGETETIRWSDLTRMTVVTTGDGPWTEDVFWLLEGAAGGCAIPQGAAGTDLLLPRLQALPGFDNSAFINAMGSATNAKFICWERVS